MQMDKQKIKLQDKKKKKKIHFMKTNPKWLSQAYDDLSSKSLVLMS